MIKVDGTLRIKKILQSRNGPFAVGTLCTNIGEFKVKDALLDQFNEGIYQVSAWIAQIFLGHYVAGGRSITEIRASLNDLQVRSEECTGAGTVGNETVGEPDPLDEPPTVKAASVAPSDESLDALRDKLMAISLGRVKKSVAPVAPALPEPAQAPAQAGTVPDDGARALFSPDLWVLIESGQPVKLDSSVDRVLLRQQAGALREQLRYEINSLDQTWYPVAA